MDIPNDSTENFMDALKTFNMQTEASMDAVRTAGDKDAQRAVLENVLLPYVPRFGTRIAELALMGASEATQMNALKFAVQFLFDSKLTEQDAFEKSLAELMGNTPKEAPAVDKSENA